MRESLFSPLWYRFADQTPRLGSDVMVRQQVSRGQTWYVLVSASTGRQSRINHSAYQFVGCCDGRHSVQQIWDTLLQQLRDQAPTQDEVIQILARLAGQGLLEYGGGHDIEAQIERRARRVGAQRRANVNPLAFRVPLGDPSGLLRALQGVGRLMFHPLVFWLWLLGVLLAAAAAALHFPALAAHATVAMGTPHYLFLAWLSFPFIKALHELGHGLAVRHWGGEVHEAGVALLVLTPAPYVDASASAGFRRRSQRAVVAAIGIMVELALAALALLVWLNVQPGLLRDLAFVTLFVASVSTLLYNANPLLRFDGYFLLCDLCDLPNLATRSRRYWVQLLQRMVFGGHRVAPMELAPGERKWLFGYGPLSFGYRVLLSAVIVFWVGHYSLALGTLIAAYVVVAVLLLPALRMLREVLAAAPATAHGWRARAVLLAAGVGVVLLVAVVPLPFRTAAWGVVWLPEQAQVRAETDGFLATFAVQDGQQVVPGQLLLSMTEPALLAQRQRLQIEWRRLGTQRFDILLRDTLAAKNLEQELRRVQGELERIDARIAQLEVRSNAAGTLVLPRQQDLVGAFIQRGTTIGYVLDRGEIGVRAAVPARDAALIRESRAGVRVRLAESMGDTLAAALVREVPAAGFELPGAALGERGGGPFAVDPTDKEGLRSIEPVVLIDLFIPDRLLERVGGRVWVMFDHGAQPLAVQSYRRLRQLFLQHFNPDG